MAVQKRNHAKGTWMVVSYPWGINVACAAMCSDGVVRKCSRIAETADTFFSIPASVRVKGKTVSGFVTIDDDTLEFIAHSSGKNAALLP